MTSLLPGATAYAVLVRQSTRVLEDNPYVSTQDSQITYNPNNPAVDSFAMEMVHSLQASGYGAHSDEEAVQASYPKY